MQAGANMPGICVGRYFIPNYVLKVFFWAMYCNSSFEPPPFIEPQASTLETQKLFPSVRIKKINHSRPNVF